MNIIKKIIGKKNQFMCYVHKKEYAWRAQVTRGQRELLYCEKFKSTIKGSQWCESLSLSPGGWAVGYTYLYVLYRVLNESNPKKILDLGLGQSSKMISAYIKMYEEDADAMHLIVEHDQSWIDFMKSNFNFSLKTEIKQLDIIEKKYYDATTSTYIYKDFETKMLEANTKWECISVDAPFGGKSYSRMDIINIIPKCLAESFIIMIDDYERIGEKKMVEVLKAKLNENNIKYAEGVYFGEKDVYILTSLDRKWFITL